MLDSNMALSLEDKLKTIKYSIKHGITATLEAAALDSNRKLSKRTLIRWRKKWKLSCEQNYGAGKLNDLGDESKKPIKARESKVNTQILQFIQLTRLQYPTLGKDKLKILVDQFCLENKGLGLNSISASTVGRLISRFKQQRIIPTWTTKQSKKVGLRAGKLVELKIRAKAVKTRRKDYTPKSPGDLVQIDCITYLIKGVRRYLVCGVDLSSRFSFSYGYDKLSSTTAKDFCIKFQEVFPYPVKHIQTDNGQEFHLHFQQYLKTQNIIQFWNYPRSPKMNAYVERFNRTIQEEYANYKQWDLKDDLELFNQGLIDWLIFYNFKRPHLGIKKDTGQFLSPMQYMKQYHEMCHMWWTGTLALHYIATRVK
jgi:transposase InsO family protein